MFVPACMLFTSGVVAVGQVQSENGGTDIYDAEVGLFGGYGFHTLSGDLTAASLSGNPNLSSACGTFTDGSGSGLAVMGTFGYRILNDLRGELALAWADYSGTMRFECVDPAEIRMPDGSLDRALTEHVMTLNRSVFQTELSFWYRPLALPVEIGAGGFVGINAGDSYRLHEEIVVPVNAEFADGGQRREYGTGRMKGRIGTGVTFGLAVSLPAGSSLLLRPQVRYYLPLSDPFEAGEFSEQSFRIGLQIAKLFRLVPPETSTPLEPAVQ